MFKNALHVVDGTYIAYTSNNHIVMTRDVYNIYNIIYNIMRVKQTALAVKIIIIIIVLCGDPNNKIML